MMPSFIYALCSRVYQSPMLSNYLSWLESSGVGLIVPLEKNQTLDEEGFSVTLRYVSLV
jgi:hypothetical protein